MTGHLWRRDETLAQRIALSPLLLAEAFYLAGIWCHRQLYLRRMRARFRLSARVISVGNLAVGGSGKTPLAAWLAAELRRRGRKVAVLSRGVGGHRGREVNVVSDGERVLLSAADVGDEPLLVASAAPGVPVLAGRNRVALGLRGLSMFGAEVLVLDDGFQHHRLARDVDLVCIDGRLGLGNGHALPRGPLREPVSALARADALVVTRALRGETELPGAERLPASLPRFRIEITPLCLRDLAGGERLPLDTLQGLRVGVVAAIARPDRLLDDLGALGAELAALRAFPDHHLYVREEISGLDDGLPWVTTGKDAVKIPRAWCAGKRVWILEEAVDGVSAAPLVEWVMARLDAPRGRP